MSHVLIEIARVSVGEYCEGLGVDAESDEKNIEYCKANLSSHEWLIDGYVYLFDIWNNWQVEEWLYDEPPADAFAGLEKDVVNLFTGIGKEVVTLWDISFVTEPCDDRLSVSMYSKLIGKVYLGKLPLLLV